MMTMIGLMIEALMIMIGLTIEALTMMIELMMMVTVGLYYLAESVDDDASGGAVEDVDGWRAGPGLQIVHTERDVLRVALVEHPHLAVRRRAGHPMPVVMQ
jgi:hypothetical protein